jgi:peptidoglycan/xylan/chitin deacetylase (PgdA/CDA1 family)
VAITFDDGFDNVYENAFPILVEMGFPATVFVVSGFCGKDNSWPSQPSGIPRLRLMGWDRLVEMSRHGISLGAHTVSHPRMTSLSQREMAGELTHCRDEIEQRTGQPVHTFAFPYGAINEQARLQAAKTYRLAVGTGMRYVSRHSDPMNLPRLDAYYLDRPLWFNHLNRRIGWSYITVRRMIRQLRGKH